MHAQATESCYQRGRVATCIDWNIDFSPKLSHHDKSHQNCYNKAAPRLVLQQSTSVLHPPAYWSDMVWIDLHGPSTVPKSTCQRSHIKPLHLKNISDVHHGWKSLDKTKHGSLQDTPQSTRNGRIYLWSDDAKLHGWLRVCRSGFVAASTCNLNARDKLDMCVAMWAGWLVRSQPVLGCLARCQRPSVYTSQWKTAAPWCRCNVTGAAKPAVGWLPINCKHPKDVQTSFRMSIWLSSLWLSAWALPSQALTNSRIYMR